MYCVLVCIMSSLTWPYNHQCCVDFSLLCSNITLFFYFGILPCYCYYSHASLAIMLKLCLFYNWEAPQTRTATNILPLVSVSPCTTSLLLLLIVRMSLSSCWSLLTCFSKFSQLNPLAATWWFAHAPCYYSGIVLKCFWFVIIYTVLSIIDSNLVMCLSGAHCITVYRIIKLKVPISL